MSRRHSSEFGCLAHWLGFHIRFVLSGYKMPGALQAARLLQTCRHRRYNNEIDNQPAALVWLVKLNIYTGLII